MSRERLQSDYGLIIIIREMDSTSQIQILDKAVCVSVCANAFRKGRYLSLFSSPIDT